MKAQSKVIIPVCIMALALSGANVLAEKFAAHAQRPRHAEAVPFIEIISPTAARVQGSAFVLILDGAGFGADAEISIQLGGATYSLPTLVVNEGEVAAYVPAKLLQKPATASVTVRNHQGHREGIASNPMMLPIRKSAADVSFQQANITLGEGAGAIVTADFNGDGLPDLAISEPCGTQPSCFSATSGNIAILLGRHDGTFAAATSIVVGNLPEALAAGDFNGDGKIDLAVGNEGASSVTILFNDGQGAFTPAASAVPVDSDPNFMAVGDFNRDGKLDLAIAHDSPSFVCSPAGCYSNAVSIRLGNGDGTFISAASIENSGDSVENVRVADLNRDGILDLQVNTAGAPYVLLFAGQGDGTFSALPSPTVPPPAGVLPADVLADVNRDGNLDFVFTLQNVPNSGQSSISTAFGNGDGLFRTGPASPVVNETLIGGALADFNGDGKLDLAEEVGFSTMAYDFFLGNGHGEFHYNSAITVSNHFVGIGPVIADFNGDGKLDLATITGDNGGTVSILLQQ